MRIGASSFAGDLPELKEEVESIELYIPKLGVYDGTKLIKEKIKIMRDSLLSYDMTTSIHAPYISDAPNYPHELIVDTSHLNDTQARLLKESIEMADYLGSNVVVIHPGRIGSSIEKSFEDMVRGLSCLAGFAEDRNVMLGLENKEGTDPGNLCCSAFELLKAIKKVNSPNLNATFDIGHANLTCRGDQAELKGYAKAIKEYVVHAHVHDNGGTFSDKYWGDFHGAPGTGIVDFSILKELDFHGVYNLEVFSIEDVRAGKKMLQKIFSLPANA